NLSSQFILSRELGKNMLARGSGKIVFVASMLSFQGGITVPGYTASKSAVAGLTKALANEWAGAGVNVNAVAPGYVTTDNTQALHEGGISCIEITFRTNAAAAAIERAARVEGMLVGAGTVLTVEQAHAAARAGARFAVAPGTDGAVVGACSAAGLPFFPGIATPSELGHAARLGCTTVKVFPAATLGGPAFLRAVSATFPRARFIPTGGVDAGSLAAYLA